MTDFPDWNSHNDFNAGLEKHFGIFVLLIDPIKT